MCSAKLRTTARGGLPVLESQIKITSHQFSCISCSHLHFNEEGVLLGPFFKNLNSYMDTSAKCLLLVVADESNSVKTENHHFCTA